MSTPEVESADEDGVRGPEERSLGSLPAMALVAGSMLGIGIFIMPSQVATQIQSPGPFLLLWLFGGVSALFGALSVAELGAMLPRAGGDYPYLRLAYGPGVAFSAGWLQLLAIFPGSLATMAVGTAQFQLPVVMGAWFHWPTDIGLPISPEAFWATVVIVGLTAVNHIGIVISGRVQLLLTGIPIGILLAASLGVLGQNGVHGGAWEGGNAFEMPPVAAGALAFLPVYFAYSGWNAAIYVGGEIHQPGRNLPRALILGTVAVTVLYLLLCVGFLSIFSMDELANVFEAGTAAAAELFGSVGVLTVTVLIVFAMLGSINGTVLTGSRIGFAMAAHGHCPAPAGRLHPKYRTPVVALWVQALWSLVLVGTQSFEELTTYTSAAMLITGTLTVLAVIRLRRKMPDTVRPYRTWGYPVTPLLYAVSSVFVLLALATTGDLSVYLAVGWFVLCLGAHRWLVQRGLLPPDDGAPVPAE